MNQSERGFFYGETTELIRLRGVTLTDTVYGQGRVDWHYHEDDYFTFLLTGGVREGHRKELYEVVAGDLLFHNWQDAHYNIASGRFTRGFHVELAESWYETLGISARRTEGSFRVADPAAKTLMYTVLKEAKLTGSANQLGVDAALSQLFALMGRTGEAKLGTRRPAWVGKIRDLLNDGGHSWTLAGLAAEVHLHPVYLSRAFPNYFHCQLGDYLRLIKVARATRLLGDWETPLTEIAFDCGFADQSHFIRCFKACYGLTPHQYRRLLRPAG